MDEQCFMSFKRVCLRSSDADVELVPVEEFYKNAPELISNPEKTRDNPHEQHLAQLSYELHERKK